MEWREFLQDELKGLLREALKRKLVVTGRTSDKSLPPLTVTVEAQDVPTLGTVGGPSNRKPRKRSRSGSKSTPRPEASELPPGQS